MPTLSKSSVILWLILKINGSLWDRETSAVAKRDLYVALA